MVPAGGGFCAAERPALGGCARPPSPGACAGRDHVAWIAMDAGIPPRGSAGAALPPPTHTPKPSRFPMTSPSFPPDQETAVVIGSGFGGLAAAIRLQARGYRVTIVEQRARTGGRAYQLREGGYTFDMGPSLITAPSIIDAVFERAGTTLARALDLVPLDPYYRVFFHDRSRFEYNGSPEDMKAQMRRYNAHDAARYDEFMEAIAPIYEEVIVNGLGSRPFGDPLTMLKFAPTAIRLGAWRTATQFANRYFTDWRHRFVFSFHALYIGGNPFHCPAIYQMIPFLER